MRHCFFTRFTLSLALCLLPVANGFAQVPQTREQITFSFAPVVKKTAPAVVNIYTSRHIMVQDNVSPFMNDPFFRQFFGGNGVTFGDRAREQVVSSLGSGVIVRPDGMIVTSYHVIKDAQEIKVALADKREFKAEITLRDPQSDLALLKIDAPGQLPSLEMRDSDSLEVGDLVLAIGNPFGVGQTVTSGIVSGLARKATGVSDYQFFIQTDAAINPGNSGGALVDMEGKLIGINTAIYSKSGGSVGIGFAIPSNMVRPLLGGAHGGKPGGNLVRPWLGVLVQPVTQEMAESLGLSTQGGVIIKQIIPSSSAQRAGLQQGDVILSINGVAISTEQELHYRTALLSIGDVAKLQAVRGGATKAFEVEMQTPPETPKRDLRTLKGSHPLDGMTVANLSPALAIELDKDNGIYSGVMLLGIDRRGIGAQVPLVPGDILLSINGVAVTSTAQLEELMDNAASRWTIAYRRGGQVASLTINM